MSEGDARPAAKHEVLARVRARIAATGTGSWFREAEHVAAAIGCAAEDPVAVLGVLFTQQVATTLAPSAAQLALRPDEWAALFAAHVRPARDADVAATTTHPACAAVIASAERALRCTLSERAERAAWGRAGTQLAVYVALHLVDRERLVHTSLGNFVGGDARRLEELSAELADGRADELALARAISTLANTVAA